MSIFPFIDSENTDVKTRDGKEELPIFKEYAYDFESNVLKKNKEGKDYLVEKNEAIRIWIFKALLVQRYRYYAYTADFGTEIEDNLIGKSLSEEIINAELQRYIVESLMPNPYIKELSEFQFVPDKNGIRISFNALTIYGIEEISFLMKGRE